MNNDRALRQHLLNLLRSRDAHLDFDRVIAGWPSKLQGVRPSGMPHTGWQLLEHLRIAQWDILEFSRDSKHVSPPFPEGLWPATEAPPDKAAWGKSVQAFRRDLKAIAKFVAAPSTDLLAPIAHGDGQTILREVLLAADHNAYHLGQLFMLRRLLGA